ncbi:MAG: cyclic nucleotide-binding domain-containing protein [Actinomycetota bacterium]
MVGAGWVTAWLVPALLGLLVIGAIWLGLRWAYSTDLASLGSLPLFAVLPRGHLRSVARSARRVEYPPGEAVTEEGEFGDSLYVIETGTAGVSVRGDHKATLGPGGYFGEVAVIDGGPRTATITAETHLSTLELPSDSMQRLLDGDPAFRRAVFLGLEGILRNAGASVPEGHGPSIDRPALTDLCRRLRELQPADWAQPRSPARRWLGLSIRRRE